MFSSQIVIIYFVISTANGGSTADPLKIQLTTGVTWKQMPSVLAYESSIPLTYSGIWDTTLEQPRLPVKCNKGNANCQRIHGIAELQQKQRKIFDNIHATLKLHTPPPSTPNVRSKRALAFIGDALSWCCGVATEEKLDHLATHETSIEAQLTQLRHGINNEILDITTTFSKFEEFNKNMGDAFTTFQDHLKSYGDELKQMLEFADKEMQHLITLEDAILKNTESSYQLARFMMQAEILDSCKEHLIPAALLPPSILTKDVARLDKYLRTVGYQTAISGQHAGRLYKLPITDCTFTGKTAIIHVKIPVIQTGSNWKIFQMIATPFSWKQETCSLQHEALFLATNNDDLRPIAGAALKNCNPHGNKLCHIPRFSAAMTTSPQCLYSLFRSSRIFEITENCPFNCYPSASMRISEVEEDTYVITHPAVGTIVNCSGKITQIDPAEYDRPGALQISLPCNCFLSSNGHILIPKKFPCNNTLPDKLKTVHLLPAAWSSLRSLHVPDASTHLTATFYNMSECLDQKWSTAIPHLNFSVTKHLQKILDDRPTDSVTNSYGVYEHTNDAVLLGWIALLTVIVTYLFRQQQRMLATIAVLNSQTTGAQALATENVWSTPVPYLAIGFTLTCTVIFGYLIYKCLQLCPLTSCRRSTANERDLELKECKDAIIILPDGRLFRITIGDELLRDGETIKLGNHGETSASRV